MEGRKPLVDATADIRVAIAIVDAEKLLEQIHNGMIRQGRTVRAAAAVQPDERLTG